MNILTRKWDGPVYFVDEVSPDVYQAEISQGKRGRPWRK